MTNRLYGRIKGGKDARKIMQKNTVCGRNSKTGDWICQVEMRSKQTHFGEKPSPSLHWKREARLRDKEHYRERKAEAKKTEQDRTNRSKKEITEKTRNGKSEREREKTGKVRIFATKFKPRLHCFWRKKVENQGVAEIRTEYRQEPYSRYENIDKKLESVCPKEQQSTDKEEEILTR